MTKFPKHVGSFRFTGVSTKSAVVSIVARESSLVHFWQMTQAHLLFQVTNMQNKPVVHQAEPRHMR